MLQFSIDVRATRRGLALVPLAAATALAGVLAPLALAPSSARAAAGDHFTCRASALRVEGLPSLGLLDAEPTVANAASDPCATDHAAVANAPAALATVLDTASGAVSATTTNAAGGGSAGADVANPSVLASTLGLTADAVSASASYTCSGTTPTPQSSSNVVGLRIAGGQPITTSGPVTLPAGGIADVELNETITGTGSVTQRAVDVTVLSGADGGVHLVLGEATAGVSGNPCDTSGTGGAGGTGGGSGGTGGTGGSGTGGGDDGGVGTSGGEEPVVDDGPPSSTPLKSATFVYGATTPGATLECALDRAAFTACDGTTTLTGLAAGPHTFSVRQVVAGVPGPAKTFTWTVTKLAAGCVATYHHGFFVRASSAKLGTRVASFHATTSASSGNIALATTAKATKLTKVVYKLDGKVVSRHAKATLKTAALSHTATHTLTATISGNGKTATVKRSFRFQNYVATSCNARQVVGALKARTTKVNGAKVVVKPVVPAKISGTAKLRFVVTQAKSKTLTRARFALNGKTLSGQHALSAGLTGAQLKASGTQAVAVKLIPRHGRTVTLSFRFKTRAV